MQQVFFKIRRAVVGALAVLALVQTGGSVSSACPLLKKSAACPRCAHEVPKCPLSPRALCPIEDQQRQAVAVESSPAPEALVEVGVLPAFEQFVPVSGRIAGARQDRNLHLRIHVLLI